VVGGGIPGVAVARRLLQVEPGASRSGHGCSRSIGGLSSTAFQASVLATAVVS
jgi:hypothetical protein